MIERQSSFEELKCELASLVDALAHSLSEAERGEVMEFVDVGEFGVALETLVDVIVEEQKELPQSAFQTILLLAKKMGMLNSVVTPQLANRVQPD